MAKRIPKVSPVVEEERPKVQTNLGEALRCYMAMKQISQRDLAPLIGIGHTTLYRVCGGAACDADTLVKILNWMMLPSA